MTTRADQRAIPIKWNEEPNANVVKKHRAFLPSWLQKMVDEAVAKASELGSYRDVAILDDGGNLKALADGWCPDPLHRDGAE